MGKLLQFHCGTVKAIWKNWYFLNLMLNHVRQSWFVNKKNLIYLSKMLQIKTISPWGEIFRNNVNGLSTSTGVFCLRVMVGRRVLEGHTALQTVWRKTFSSIHNLLPMIFLLKSCVVVHEIQGRWRGRFNCNCQSPKNKLNDNDP